MNDSTSIRWVKFDESVRIHDLEITGGNFYHTSNSDDINHNYIFPIVDDFSKITQNSNYTNDEGYSTTTSYQVLSPEIRGSYLNWLASERDIAYSQSIFISLYLYGIEWRLFFDYTNQKMDDDEFMILFSEVNRIKEHMIDKDNESEIIIERSHQILEAMGILRPMLIDLDLLLQNPLENSILVDYLTAKYASMKLPLNGGISFGLLRSKCTFNLTITYSKFQTIFYQYFCLIFENRSQKPMLPLKSTNQIIEFSYRGSAHHKVFLSKDFLKPNIPLKFYSYLEEVAELIIEKMRSFSYYVLNDSNDINDLKALHLLPSELNGGVTKPTKEKIENWLEGKQNGNTYIIDNQKFGYFLGKEKSSEIGIRDADYIKEILEECNYKVGPNKEIHILVPDVIDKVFVYKRNKDLRQSFIPSKEFQFSLFFGSMFIEIGHCTQTNLICKLFDTISENVDQYQLDKIYFEAHLNWFMDSDIELKAIEREIQRLSNQQIDFLRELVISVALINGDVFSLEVRKLLIKIYSLFKLTDKQIDQDLSSKLPLKIDACFLKEEKSNSDILWDIFGDEVYNEKEDTVSIDNEEGLDFNHTKLLDIFLKIEHISKKELIEICKKMGLMPVDATNRINEWVYEQVEELLLLESNETYRVDSEVLDLLYKDNRLSLAINSSFK